MLLVGFLGFQSINKYLLYPQLLSVSSSNAISVSLPIRVVSLRSTSRTYKIRTMNKIYYLTVREFFIALFPIHSLTDRECAFPEKNRTSHVEEVQPFVKIVEFVEFLWNSRQIWDHAPWNSDFF